MPRDALVGRLGSGADDDLFNPLIPFVFSELPGYLFSPSCTKIHRTQRVVSAEILV